MNYFIKYIFLSVAVYTSAIGPEIQYMFGCFDSGDFQVVMEVDGDEVFYVDFKKKEAMWTVPHFTNFKYAKFRQLVHQYSELSRMYCHTNLIQERHWTASFPTNLKAPGSTIYPKEKIELESENTLICFVNDFFPPSINVKWTKNNVELTEGSLGRYHPNKDGTFFQVSTLTFTPQDGDVYACTVEHPALESPRTRFWEVEVNESSAGPAVFCGVGLTLGLLGVATGTFLLVKQPQSNQGA
uniref:H-2 class II histocompatibility antigen, A-K alpha chain n=1 Tax=Osmerus mordax TaxID=8014 RepID=C1BLY7_OSMMO|nr:H-2 class II histocompatibility antigen, A-K alpha chain precursor [Osmerus mordax]